MLLQKRDYTKYFVREMDLSSTNYNFLLNVKISLFKIFKISEMGG